MNTRNKKSRRPDSNSKTTSQAQRQGEGDSKLSKALPTSPSLSAAPYYPSKDLESLVMETEEVEVPVPEWVVDMFGSDSIISSQLTQLFKAFMGLHQLQQRNTLCDVNIKVQETTFHAHKAVLSASSKFFRVMFTSGFQESHGSDVAIAGKPEAFKVILDYIYSGELALAVDTVVDVLEMAHYLQLDLVMKRCENYLIAELNDQGIGLEARAAIRSLATAQVYGLEGLVTAAKAFLAKNFRPTVNFVSLMTAELLEEIIGRTDLKDEKQVFDTTLAWLQHDWNNRKQFAARLFSKIRLGIVPLGHMSMTIFKYPKLYAIEECKKLIDKALQMADAWKPIDPPLHFKEPNLFSPRTMVFAILGIDDSVNYYDVETRKWVSLTKFPRLPEKDNNEIGDSCLSTEGHLYVSRGTRYLPRKLKCPQFLRLDMVNSRWVPLEPMVKRRQNPRLVAVKGKIYAVGGDLDEQPLTCEVYRIGADNWKTIRTDFEHQIYRPTVESCVAFQGKVLVYGTGTMFRQGNTCVDHFLKMYDPVGRWSNLWTTSHPESSFTGLVINEGKCYRVTGFSCDCKIEGCQWHKMNVHEIIIDFNTRVARSGEEQDQELITRASLPATHKNKAFRINQDVYLIFNNKFFKTGIKLARNRTDPVKLGVWKNLRPLTSRSSLLLAHTMFDKAKWL